MDSFIFQFINQFAGRWPLLDGLEFFLAQYFGYVLVGILLVLVLVNRKRWIGVFFWSFLSAIFSRFVIAEIIRFFYNRPRPFEALDITQLFPHGPEASFPSGHCGSFDTVEKHINGSRRYVVTFTDVYSRFSFAMATKSHASRAAKEFFDLVTFLFPFPFTYVLTDNGSEFMKEFDEELRQLHVIHWHTYPRTPKMNSRAERFNRTIQEEYIDYYEADLLEPEHFNIGLYKHLLWHNTESCITAKMVYPGTIGGRLSRYPDGKALNTGMGS